MDALDGANDPPVLFVRTGNLVRVRMDQTGPFIEPVGDYELRARLSVVANFVNEKAPTYPPMAAVRNIRARKMDIPGA